MSLCCRANPWLRKRHFYKNCHERQHWQFLTFLILTNFTVWDVSVFQSRIGPLCHRIKTFVAKWLVSSTLNVSHEILFVVAAEQSTPPSTILTLSPSPFTFGVIHKPRVYFFEYFWPPLSFMANFYEIRITM